jgi:hypothetical protein
VQRHPERDRERERDRYQAKHQCWQVEREHDQEMREQQQRDRCDDTEHGARRCLRQQLRRLGRRLRLGLSPGHRGAEGLVQHVADGGDVGFDRLEPRGDVDILGSGVVGHELDLDGADAIQRGPEKREVTRLPRVGIGLAWVIHRAGPSPAAGAAP